MTNDKGTDQTVRMCSLVYDFVIRISKGFSSRGAIVSISIKVKPSGFCSASLKNLYIYIKYKKNSNIDSAYYPVNSR